ncbi:MAG TPA: hypothetical protein VK457_02640 [Chloroflexota bacterium]|nr:hypothetical protein [Chloroflexota bacterium]
MSPEETPEFRLRRVQKSVIELTVDLTIAWLKRVEGTADGRDPKEVVQALNEFYSAVQQHHESEMDAEEQREGVPAH